MRCPACAIENYSGEDACINCGADLWGADVPQDLGSFQGRLLGEHIDAIAVGDPRTVEPTVSAARAIEQMHAQGVDSLLVMHEGRLVGIFTERDALLKLADKQRLDAFDVRDVMTRDPVVLRPEDSLAVAIHKMAVGGFRHIPVMDGDRPIGVVAARDIFHHILAVLG
jgi:CBS domain-containing protein